MKRKVFVTTALIVGIVLVAVLIFALISSAGVASGSERKFAFIDKFGGRWKCIEIVEYQLISPSHTYIKDVDGYFYDIHPMNVIITTNPVFYNP